MRIVLLMFILFSAISMSYLWANQNLVVPKTRLKYILPDRENFDEKIQHDFEEIN